MPEPFAALVDRVVDRLIPIPVITPEQYRTIECNRCGLCCEDIRSASSPTEMAAQIADPATEADRRRFLSGLVPASQVGTGWRYRCTHFGRDADGLGRCGIHQTRPDVCRGFPYGRVVRSWRECSWFVEVRDANGDRVDVVTDNR
jgi:Fe-S-cluster containining protein